jgi:hypothetical protein
LSFHTGHRTTPEHKARRFGAPHPAMGPAPFPPAASLRRFLPSIFDQGETETCFAHVQSELFYLCLAAQGTGLLWVPSPLAIARNTYCEEQTDPNLPLQDTGADMGDVMTATAREGIRAIGKLAPGRFSDVTPEVIVLRPTLADDELAAKTLVLGPEQLQRSAPDFVPQLATTIANIRCGISVGIHASPAFQRYQAGAPAISDLSGFSETDGHDVAACDYRTNATTGELEFWLRSSWGTFGDEGGAWVTASWLTGGGCLEAWRMRVRVATARVIR